MGSSRAERYDPKLLQVAGAKDASTGFNAAIFHTRIVDEMAWALYALDHPGRDGKPPQLIFTLTERQLSHLPASRGLMSTDPLWSSLHEHAERGNWDDQIRVNYGAEHVDSVGDVGRVLWSQETTQLSFRSLGREWSTWRSGHDADENLEAEGGFGPYASDGVRLDQRGDLASETSPKRYREHLRSWHEDDEEAGGDNGAPDVSATGDRMMSYVLKHANDAGITPVIVLLPQNPENKTAGDDSYSHRHSDELHAELARLQKSFDFELVDLENAEFRHPQGMHLAWLDSTHPTTYTARNIMLEIAKQTDVFEAATPLPPDRPVLVRPEDNPLLHPREEG
jgi:hypothetical protein